MENVFKKNEYIFDSKEISISKYPANKNGIRSKEIIENIVICEEFCYNNTLNTAQLPIYPSKQYKKQNLKYLTKKKN